MTGARFAFAIDQATNDLFLAPDGNVATVTDAEAVGQHVRQRLQTHRGEWFLDTDAGMPWLRDILGHQFNPALAESVVKAEVLNTDGVEAITSFAVSFDRASRGLIIRDIEVETVYDERASV